MECLTQRALNRATLARQHLLERTNARAIDVIERLGGMQSQAPLAPYIGLWTRIDGFDPEELSRLTEERHVARAPMMRNTLHLVSARDCLAWQDIFTGMRAAEYAAHFGELDGASLNAVLTAAQRLLKRGPLTRAQLGALLASRWQHADPSALAHAATHHLAVCQVPPRGIWGTNGPAAWALATHWLDAPQQRSSVESLAMRYFAAFGPATIADAQQWSGLRKLSEVVERMTLRIFRGERGQVLYDLPDAPRPDEDTPAPPRLLPAYDNLLLSHRDRTRINPDGRPVPLPPGSGVTTGTFLIDGVWSGTWHAAGSDVRVDAFTTLRPHERDALLKETERLAAFITPHESRAREGAVPH